MPRLADCLADVRKTYKTPETAQAVLDKHEDLTGVLTTFVLCLTSGKNKGRYVPVVIWRDLPFPKVGMRDLIDLGMCVTN